MTLGYLLAFVTYVLIGAVGYIGFAGVAFSEYALKATGTEYPLAQNCMLMFSKTNVTAFIMRTIVFCLVFSSFPILNHFFRSGVIKLIYGNAAQNSDVTRET